MKDSVRYRCTGCGREVERHTLTVKRATFLSFGRERKLLKARVVAWLCDSCRESDLDWQRESAKGGTPHPPAAQIEDVA